MISNKYIVIGLMLDFIKPGRIHDLDCKFKKLSRETQIDPICWCLNIFFKMLSLIFFKTKPPFCPSLKKTLTLFNLNFLLKKRQVKKFENWPVMVCLMIYF